MKRKLLTLLLMVLLAAAGRAAPDRVVEHHYDVGHGMSGDIVGGGVQDRRGLLWFATWGGLDCYDGYRFHHIRIRPGDRASISSNRIRDILAADSSTLLCHTDNDVYEFDLDRFTFRNVDPARRDSLLALMGRPWTGMTDAQGCRWTTEADGLRKTYRPHHPATVLPATAGDHPGAMMADADGRLWIGTRAAPGISIYDSIGRPSARIALSAPPYAIVRTAAGSVWVGCKPGALMRLGGPRLSDDIVYDMAQDSGGRLWIATFGNGVKCCPDPEAAVPALSGSFGGGKVRRLIVTPSGGIVAATTDGLLVGRIDSADYRRTRLRPVRRDSTDPSSLASDATMCVARDSRGVIYVSTESSGIDAVTEESLFAEKPVFTHFTTSNSQLPGDIVRAMTLVNDSTMIVCGNDNVALFNPLDGSAVNYNRMFWADTCRMAEAEPLVLDDGSVVVATKQGAFVATPHNLYSRGYIPPVVFTTLSVNGGNAEFALAPLHQVVLEPTQRNVSVGFAAIDFTDNSGILYRTSLDGSPWSEASTERQITLFNLTPGSHTLSVQSTDRYGRRVDNCRSITLIVKPFWHETWWARSLFALLIAAAAGGVVATVVYIRRLHRQRRDLFEKYMALITADSASATAASAPPASPALTVNDAVRNESDRQFLDRVRRYVELNLANPDANIDAMAAASAVSRSTLNRRLRSTIGISAAQLLIEARMRHAAELLADPANSALSITDIALRCGYTDAHYFQRAYAKRHGQPIRQKQ